MSIKQILKNSIYLLLIYSSTSLVAVKSEADLPILAPIKDIQNIYIKANILFDKHLYADAKKNYYELVKAHNSDNNILFNSWKNIGIIDINYHQWDAAIDHLSRAKKIKPNDYKINSLLNDARKKNTNHYIIQLGVFESSYNANLIIKNISTAIDDFTLIKKKYGNKYIVYFDGFKNKDQADTMSERLKSLNNGHNFIVKNKNQL